MAIDGAVIGFKRALKKREEVLRELTEAASEVKYKTQRLKDALDAAYKVLEDRE